MFPRVNDHRRPPDPPSDHLATILLVYPPAIDSSRQFFGRASSSRPRPSVRDAHFRRSVTEQGHTRRQPLSCPLVSASALNAARCISMAAADRNASCSISVTRQRATINALARRSMRTIDTVPESFGTCRTGLMSRLLVHSFAGRPTSPVIAALNSRTGNCRVIFAHSSILPPYFLSSTPNMYNNWEEIIPIINPSSQARVNSTVCNFTHGDVRR